MKPTASILFNTNRAVSSSEDSWASFRPGSFVRFSNDEAYYVVGSVKPLFYIRDLTIGRFAKATVGGDIGINLSVGDCVQISFKEYELLTVITPTKSGSGYKQGDKVFLVGGDLVFEPSTGISRAAAFIVTQTDGNGAILQIRLEDKGKYLRTPDKVCAVTGGSGAGAEFQVEYLMLENRALVERTIVSIEHSGSSTEITFDAQFPAGVTEGKLSINKWEMYLSSNYAGESLVNTQYEITRDFTPNVGLPLLMENSFNPVALYNLAVKLIDSKFKELQDQIDKGKS